MLLLAIDTILTRLDAGQRAQVTGPEVHQPALDMDSWRPGQLFRSSAFGLHVARGPLRAKLELAGPSWALVVPLGDGVELTLPEQASNSAVLERGDTVLFAPGARGVVDLTADAALELIVAPPQNAGALSPLAAHESVVPCGLTWLVRRNQVEPALSLRDKVKIAEGNLWRPQAPPGVWSAGSEILSEAVAFGFFRTGAPETAHQHERSWELYHVVEGQLCLNVRSHRLGPWEPVVLTSSDVLVLPPGAAHLVDTGCRHLSMAVQAPPAISDRETASFTSGDPSLDLPFDD